MSTLLSALQKNALSTPPVWIMRQAGRYLPEYRKLRQQIPNFMDFCFRPDMVTEVTLQPINRFDLDAAIIFSDILVIPHALGREVTFKSGHGPQLEKITDHQSIERIAAAVPDVVSHLQPVMEGMRQVRAKLPKNKALIGFCGAPWTVAAYMLDDQPSKDCLRLRQLAYADPAAFHMLMQSLVEASVLYLCAQVEAGADALMIFDSWAALAPPALFKDAITQPLLEIAQGVHNLHPNTPIVLFPRGVAPQQLAALAQATQTQVAGLGLSHTLDLSWAVQNLQPAMAIQGNLDPAVLLTEPRIIRQKTKEMLNMAARQPGYIVNLGHGIHKDTPLENVHAFVEAVRTWK
jgi:uroporphyrinogen decarboxylase